MEECSDCYGHFHKYYYIRRGVDDIPVKSGYLSTGGSRGASGDL